TETMPGKLTDGNVATENRELIDLRITELSLLFNAMDPSPPGEKDLDPKVEEFIVSWARASSRDAQFGLRVYVGLPAPPEQVDIARDAIHEFFRQRSLSASRKLSQLFRVGRTSLVIGVVFLAVVVTIGGLVERVMGESRMSTLIRESMIIGGWVAMWRPLEIFLYDWWPILAERKLFDRLSVMPVTIVPPP
ncbi:MAG TPA: hypothetical protein VD758_05215, partial [Gemmatimonadaceae bacterium]|nr:hypothetical protein [Gemmatimonadaceae bacterium]